jgi:hypothetical protein
VNGASTASLRTALTTALGSSRTAQVMQITTQGRTQQRPRGNFANIWEWAVRTNLTSAEFSKVIGQVTALPSQGNDPARAGTAPRTAKINVNTAAKAVLACLPGLEEADVTGISGHRQANVPTDPSDISWLLDVVSPKSKLTGIGGLITGKSSCYSGDIVAVSADGRAFKRYRVVIDGSTGVANIIYRRDVTGMGWPLPAEVRDGLRAGQGIDRVAQTYGKGAL